MITAIQQLMANYRANHDKKMFLTASPETAALQGGQSAWGGIWGSYLPLLDALRDSIDLLHVQLYNSGTMYGLDGGIYEQGTADFIVSQTEVVLLGFTAVGGAGSFAGFDETKVAIGLPACPDAAGGGYTLTDTVKAAIDYLRGLGPQPGAYALEEGPYPYLGGMMTWSINWDAQPDCNGSAYVFAANFEDAFDNCAKPDLGADLSLCEISFPVTLHSNTPTGSGITFTWINLTANDTLINQSAVANTWDISSGGSYRVVRDSAGCRRTDDIAVLNDLPVPNLPVATTLCDVVPISLAPANAGSFPGGTTWQWYQNNTPINGATNSSLSNIRQAADFKLVAQKGNCTTEWTTEVDTDLPAPEDGCSQEGEQVSLSITTASSGPFNWYENSTGGTPVGTGINYETPVLYATTTYFVEDESLSGGGVTGPPPTGNGFGYLQGWSHPTEVVFDAHMTFTLEAVSVYPLIWCYVHTLTFEFRDANDHVLPNGAHSFNIDAGEDCSLSMQTAVELVLPNGGVEIPQGNGYKIVRTGDIDINHWEGSVSYPMDYSPYFTITGGNVAEKYMAVHDWKIAGASCARMPVVAEIDVTCGASLPVDLTAFTVILQGREALLNWKTENEVDNMGFHVERKIGAGSFEHIGWVDAQSGTQNHYHFWDADIRPNHTYYYRLKQEDLNGKLSLSPVRSVSYQDRMPVGYQLFPNPASEIIQIRSLNNEPVNPVETIQLFNAQGMSILEDKMAGGEHMLRVGHLPKGCYWLKIGNAQTREYIRFLLQ